MKYTPKEYNEKAKQASPKSKSYINIPVAFLLGGGICTIGQILVNLYKFLGMTQDIAGTTASVTLIFVSALLTGLTVFDNIAKHAGAGTLVPITGFANAVVAPALDFKSEGLILGLGAKMFIIAGPVIVYGTLASVLYGVIYYFIK